MPAPQPVTTIEELLALPEDGMRHELLDGEHVVTPAPALLHQFVLGELYAELRQAVAEHAGLELFLSPADIRLGPRTLVQPDLFIISSDPEQRPREWSEVGIPLLAVEVLSPSTAARDRGKKRRLYLEAGVEEYWIVDLDARLVERWRQGDERPEMVDGMLEWSVGGAAGTLDVAGLFERTMR
jgi:Uma2 family endonuclease